MAKPLTAVTIANLRPKPKDSPKRYEVSDGGCQGLRVVVFPSGKRSFITRFRFRGLQRKLTLGPCLIEHNGEVEPDTAPQIDTPLSLAAARELATKALRQAKSGTDPTEGKRKRKEEQRAAEADTLRAVCEEYLRREGPRMRTVGQRRADLELFYPALGRLPIDQIRRGSFVRVLDHVADTRGPVRADRALSALKTMLGWYAQRTDYVSVLPRGGRRTSPREQARSRTLSDDELRKVWLAAEQDTTLFGGYIRFLLLTATRRGEAAGLRRSELSPDGTVWVIPGERYKSKRDVVLPLSKPAQTIVAAQPVAGDFVFSADGSRALGGFAERKTDFDKLSGVSGWRLHDLRRTARTLLSRCGVRPDIAERILGHSVGGHLGAVYDQHPYIEEMREGVEALAQMVERIVRPPPAKIADMAAERRKRHKHKTPA
jgi:integrase